jgi:hypothetical protein
MEASCPSSNLASFRVEPENNEVIMNTTKAKTESKPSKDKMKEEDHLVLHTQGGEMPAQKKLHGREFLNAKAIFSEKVKKK